MNLLFPITFSIPEEKIVTSIPNKTKILSNLIPGKLETYIYNNEEDYYNEYKKSYFAVTTKKGGWDCLRHYEIIANGCIPYFPNIEECPKNTLSLFPKILLYEGNFIYKNLKDKGINNLTNDDINECKLLIQELLDYLRNYLTTNKIAKYILQKTNFEYVKNILFLSSDTSPDYLRCLTLQGFKEIFGSKCHDYPKVPHIYKDGSIDYSLIYGKGITYTNLLDPILHDNNLDNNIENYIKEKYFDIIIFGSYHRGMSYYDLISSIYNPNEIILLCGEDLHKCDYDKWVNKKHYVFVREL